MKTIAKVTAYCTLKPTDRTIPDYVKWIGPAESRKALEVWLRENRFVEDAKSGIWWNKVSTNRHCLSAKIEYLEDLGEVKL